MIDARIEIKKRTIEKCSKNTRQLMIIEIKVFFFGFFGVSKSFSITQPLEIFLQF